MRIENLQYVLEVTRAGSISAAAKKLWIGQTTLSAAIQTVEKELGMELFVRTAKGIIPTPKGKDAIRMIERILADYQKLTELSKHPTIQYASCYHRLLSSFLHTARFLSVTRKRYPFQRNHSKCGVRSYPAKALPLLLPEKAAQKLLSAL